MLGITISVRPEQFLNIESLLFQGYGVPNRETTFFPSIVSGIVTFPSTDSLFVQFKFFTLSFSSSSYAHSIPWLSSFHVRVSAFTIDGIIDKHKAITAKATN